MRFINAWLVEWLFLRPNYFLKTSLYFAENMQNCEYTHFSNNLLKTGKAEMGQ